MTTLWEKEHPLLANALGENRTYVVGDVEEEHIMWQRSVVLPVVMEKQRSLRHILGEQKTFTEKDYARRICLL